MIHWTTSTISQETISQAIQLGESIHNLYLTKDLYPDYIKSSYKLIKANKLKIGKRLEHILYKRRCINDQ